MNVSQMLQSLHDNKVCFVFLDGYQRIQSGKPAAQATILTDDLPGFVRAAGLLPASGSLYRSESIHTAFYVLEAGRGWFPSKYESSMLRSRDMTKNPLVPIPLSTHLYNALMYWKLFRENLWQNEPEFRSLAIEHVTNFTGPEIPAPKVA